MGFVDFNALKIVETLEDVLPPDVLDNVNLVWSTMIENAPHLFDGPALICTDFAITQGAFATLTWKRATYRYIALRQIPNSPRLGSVFVCVVQPTTDGRLLLGVASSVTNTPGQWQMPGGTAEPPKPGQLLTVSTLAAHAAQELIEETGIHCRPEDLQPWLVGQMPNGNVGCFFIAPALPEPIIRREHRATVRMMAKTGRVPELHRIMLIGPNDYHAGKGLGPDYLGPVLVRFFATPESAPDVGA